MKRTTKYLGIQEGSKDSYGSSKSIDGLDWCFEYNDWWDYDRYTFHGVTNAKCQGRDLVQGHVWHLVVEMIEHTLGRHPPMCTINSHNISKWKGKKKITSNFLRKNRIQQEIQCTHSVTKPKQHHITREGKKRIEKTWWYHEEDLTPSVINLSLLSASDQLVEWHNINILEHQNY